MAQMVLGIDLGSHMVKAAMLEVGFRKARVVRLHTAGVEPGPRPSLERSLEALARLEGIARDADLITLGLPGDQLLSRVFDIPIADPRKLGAVVGNELADDIPWEMEDVLYDHAPLPLMAGKVLVVAGRSALVKDLLSRLLPLSLEPRSLPPAALAYGRLVRLSGALEDTLLLDIGHLRTNISLVSDGRVLIARTVSRGGHQLTLALRQTFQLSYEEAETLKESSALASVEGGRAPGKDQQGLLTVTQEALMPLAREVRFTLGAFAAQLGRRPTRVLLCGGTSLLAGLDDFLSAQLGLPCQRLSVADGPEFEGSGLSDEGKLVGAQALGLCLEQGGRGGLDLRQGEYAFRTDSSIFREKLVTLAVSVVLILVFITINALMSLTSLRKDETALKLELKKATQTVFGEPVASPTKVSRMVKAGSKAGGHVIPDKTAFDILAMLSSTIPSGKEVKLDIAKLDIKPGKTYITGTANSRTEIGEIVKSLEADACVSKVASGKISDVAEGKKQFTLTITTECF